MATQSNKPRYQYFAVYKPFGYLSQFTPEVEGQKTLADLHNFPKDVYAVGRLDKDSEGLLILSNDKSLTKTLLDPQNKKYKTYLVQVEGAPTDADLSPLRQGMKLRIRKKELYTQPAIATCIAPPVTEARTPPIRERKSIPDSWISLSITEGKYHQVRKMCAAIGFPVLRLIRVQVGEYRLPNMAIGKVYEIEKQELGL